MKPHPYKTEFDLVVAITRLALETMPDEQKVSGLSPEEYIQETAKALFADPKERVGVVKTMERILLEQEIFVACYECHCPVDPTGQYKDGFVCALEGTAEQLRFVFFCALCGLGQRTATGERPAHISEIMKPGPYRVVSEEQLNRKPH